MSRAWYLVGMLALLFVANLGMLLGMTNWPQRVRERFASRFSGRAEGMDTIMNSKSNGSVSLAQGESFANRGSKEGRGSEGFLDYLVDGGFGTAPIGSYDGMNLADGFPPESQGFRARMPNVPHPPGTTMLPFVNNECKPECCGSTMSCDGGGCVCTTPEDRDLINTRGGNRRHDDGF